MTATAHADNRHQRLRNLKPDLKLKKGGPVAERVAQLLADPILSLGDIAERVVNDVPGAHTSARSVASVAAQLRRDGYRVPDRRHRNRSGGRAAAH